MLGFVALFLAGALAIAIVLFNFNWRGTTEIPDEVVQAIEQHLAPEGTVMFIRPVLMSFGKPSPGAQQYSVNIVTGYGFSRTHTVEVDPTGHARTLL